ncbi:MAG: ribonuclease R [Bacteroidetes bacterium]|nr:ribonuclease R [Bacteroidota bacterium]
MTELNSNHIKLKNQIFHFFKKNREKKVKLHGILKNLNLPRFKLEALRNILYDLVDEGLIVKEGKLYSLNKIPPSSILEGTIDFGSDGRFEVKHFNNEGSEIRYKIIGTSSRTLNLNDKVTFQIKETDGISFAEINTISREEIKFVTGDFENNRSYGTVYPDSRVIKKHIYIEKRFFAGAKDGDKVYCEITNPQDINNEFTDLKGVVKEVLGKSGNAEAELNSIAKKFALEKDFPNYVVDEAEAIKFVSETKGRIDLRGETIFTIDPVDARDFDDAVSLEKTKDGFRLGVHIADVSHYVKEGSNLDKEAHRRGTSVYLVDGVIPMLPENLSNDICSLKPNVDRLAFSIFINLTKKYHVKDFEIKKSIINSKRRFTYEEAQMIVETKKGDFAKELLLMYKVSKCLTQNRIKSGGLDFDTREVKFIFDKKGKVKKIVPKERLDTMRLIEEFMLLANICATLYVKNLQKDSEMLYPFIYRVHDNPDIEKLKNLSEFVNQFGYKVNVNDKDSLAKLLEDVKGKPEEYIINDLLIRSMAKAIYTHKNIGHYGLGFEHYTHFTSPIRRYPDLIVHRILFDYMNSKKNILKAVQRYNQILPEVCKRSSEREQNAVAAERESIKIKQIEYLQSRVGDEYDGIISGIVQFGIYVQIDDILIEGMVRFKDIEDDYYEFDEKKHIAFGRRTKRILRAGDKVRISVARVNMFSKKIDFAIV